MRLRLSCHGNRRKQRLQCLRVGLLGQAPPEQRIEMLQQSGLKELVMSVSPITTLKLTKDIKIMNKTSSFHCAEEDTLSQ